MNYFEETVQQAHLHEHELYLTYQRDLRDDTLLTVTVTDIYTNLGNNSFENAIAVLSSIAVGVNETSYVEFGYEFYDYENSFFNAAGPVNDRDSHSSAISIMFVTEIPGVEESELYVGYSFTNTTADGADFDSETDTWFIGFEAPLSVMNATIGAQLSRVTDNYDNPHSFSGFATKRDDDTYEFEVIVIVPIGEKVDWYLSYLRETRDSNIAVFDYDQQIISTGLTLHVN